MAEKWREREHARNRQNRYIPDGLDWRAQEVRARRQIRRHTGNDGIWTQPSPCENVNRVAPPSSTENENPRQKRNNGFG